MLESCPRCSYSLQGLPVDHACPECGLRYDSQSAIYRHLHPAAVFGTLGGGVAWLWGGLNLMHAYQRVPAGWRMVIVAFWLLFILFTVFMVRYCWRLYRRGLIVAVVRDGLFVRLQKLDGELIPWSNIARAAPNKGLKSVALFIRDARAVRDVAGVFRAPADVQRFADQVNARTQANPPSNHEL